MACIAFENVHDPRDREFVHVDSWTDISVNRVALPSGRQVTVLDRRNAPPHEPFHGEHPVTYVMTFMTPALIA